MKLKTVSLLAGASVPLILAGSASGEFFGLTTAKKPVDPADIAGDAANIPGVTSLLVVNVYAEFTPGDAAASVIAVGGSAALGIPLQVNVADGTFFQHVFGRDLSPIVFPLFLPTLKHDSFVTIGRKFDSSTFPDETQLNGLDSWTDTRLTGSDEVSWFLAGFPAQGKPDQGGHNPPDLVLIGQFTVANFGPFAGAFGQMFIKVRHTNAAGVVETLTVAVSFDNQIPAPGTLALLGLAGLMGTRRRRKSLTGIEEGDQRACRF